MGLKLGLSCIFAKDYTYGSKILKDAIIKNEDEPTSKQLTNQLNTLQAVLSIGQEKYDKVC
jgi:hypothetical protein